MFYENWMSYIKDDAKITKIAMPGSHNSGTMGMIRFAEWTTRNSTTTTCNHIFGFGKLVI